MEFRRIRLSTEVVNFCLSKEVNPPIDSSIIFGAYDNGILVGVCALKQVYQIEPLIVEGSPHVTQILGEKMMAVASLSAHEVIAMIKSENESYINQLERYGFVITDKSMTILKKEV